MPNMMTARTFALSLCVCVFGLAGTAVTQGWADEDDMIPFLRATPLFGKSPVALTPDEREQALGWPITKVYLTTKRLILNRSEPGSGRTAAFFYMIRVNDERWKTDFQFWMREISDAYWSEEIPAPPLLALHRRAQAHPGIKAWERLEPAGGYLLDAVKGPGLVVQYTRGTPPIPSTELLYPLFRMLWIGDQTGFVAEVAPAKTREGQQHR